MAQINLTNLRRELDPQINKIVYPKIRARIEREFETSKDQLVRSFVNAGPSKELDELANTDRESRVDYVSPYTQGHGNLYAFLGFANDRNPTEEVKDYLEQNVRLKSITHGAFNRDGNYVVTGKVEVPTLKEINASSTLDWSSRGWIDALVNGVRGMPEFLFGMFADNPKSLSGAGIELKKTRVRSDSFKPYNGNYLSQFLERFKVKIRTGKTTKE